MSLADDQSNDRGSVVVTGTSTGIGAATVSRLATLGFHVFAGVRREEDAEAVRRGANGQVTPLMIDITETAMIEAAARTVEHVVAERGLAGLVNNAGIVKPGPLEFQPLDDFRRQLEVNLIGPLAVIQAFLPLIRRGRGRIVNVGSIGGLLVLPIQGAYSASKFGLEALSDAFRLELRQWKIPVSHVDPGVPLLQGQPRLHQEAGRARGSDLARRGTHFVADGNQVMSIASWPVFMRKNEPRSRYFDVPLPRPNLKVDFAEQAQNFAHELTELELHAAEHPEQAAHGLSAAERGRDHNATR